MNSMKCFELLQGLTKAYCRRKIRILCSPTATTICCLSPTLQTLPSKRNFAYVLAERAGVNSVKRTTCFTNSEPALLDRDVKVYVDAKTSRTKEQVDNETKTFLKSNSNT